MGAIIRSAVAAGAEAVIVPKHRSALINGTVYKTSAGLVDKIKNLTSKQYYSRY